jgi:hypothetical protein
MLFVDAGQFYSIICVLHLFFINHKKQTDTMYKFKLLANCLILAASLTLLSSSSCKKDDDPVNTKTKKDYLIQSAWKVIKAESRTNPSSAWSDVSFFLQPCDKDNNFVFKANNTYEINEGATKCDVADPQIVETGVWVFENNETVVRLTPAGDPPIVLNIEQLDDNTLIGNGSDNSTGSIVYSRLTFGH